MYWNSVSHKVCHKLWYSKVLDNLTKYNGILWLRQFIDYNMSLQYIKYVSFGFFERSGEVNGSMWNSVAENDDLFWKTARVCSWIIDSLHMWLFVIGYSLVFLSLFYRRRTEEETPKGLHTCCWKQVNNQNNKQLIFCLEKKMMFFPVLSHLHEVLFLFYTFIWITVS